MALLSRRTSIVRASVLALFLSTGAALGAAAPAAAGSANAPSCSGLAAVSAVSYTGVRADGKTRVDYGSQKLTATIPGTTKINRNLTSARSPPATRSSRATRSPRPSPARQVAPERRSASRPTGL
jgi:hypothetical protein